MPRESWGDPVQMGEIGARIRARRKELELSQKELSRQAGTRGVSAAYICRLEAGDRMPSFNALRQLAEPLKTTAQWLETGDNGDQPRYRLYVNEARTVKVEVDENGAWLATRGHVHHVWGPPQLLEEER